MEHGKTLHHLSLANIGMVTDASWTDIDSDGDKDLVVVGDWMAINIFKNENGILNIPSLFPIAMDGGTGLNLRIWISDGDHGFRSGKLGIEYKV